MKLLDRLQFHASGAATAYRDGDRSLAYQQLLDQIRAIAAAVRATTPPGAVVLIRLPNGLDFPPAFLGVLAAGRVAFPVSPDSPPAELASVIARANVAAMIGAEPVGSLRLIDPADCGTADQAASSDNPPAAMLLLSSGSTGRPKIVRRSVASIDAVCRQMADATGITPRDKILATVPLCHSYGIEHGLLAPVWAGAETRLVRGLELGRVQSELDTGGITILPGVPSTFEMLATHSRGEKFPTLRAAYSAGGHLPPTVAAAFAEKCGTPVGQIYGATEIGSVTYTPTHDGTVGRAMDGVHIRIDDGRVLVRAGSMFDRYLDDPTPIIDGFYPTGDLGHRDDAGRLTITGRATLLIDVGGSKVDPLEVERIIAAHPRVADCVVVPVRQSETVVRIKAIITPRDAANPPTTEQLRMFSREHLSAHKVPRVFEIRAELPRTVTGKILRHQVQA